MADSHTSDLIHTRLPHHLNIAVQELTASHIIEISLVNYLHNDMMTYDIHDNKDHNMSNNRTKTLKKLKRQTIYKALSVQLKIQLK